MSGGLGRLSLASAPINLKILLCHNYYQQNGGEDQSFEDEARLLEAYGHQVLRFTVHNNELGGMHRVRLAGKTLWNHEIYRQLRDLLRAERPAVMHCTNTFPLVSPAAYYAARREGVAVVQSLRNYRLMCANALFLRNESPCEKCLRRAVPWPALMHRCYRGDVAATAVITAMVAAHRVAGTWRRCVDMYFTPSEFARRKFEAAGFAGGHIAVKPNSVFPEPQAGNGSAGGAIFVGRLAPEKGVGVLLDAWLRHDVPVRLKIIGNGPLAGRVSEACRRCDRIEWLGQLALSEVLKHVGEASLLVYPSIAYETFGRSVVEAFAVGTPVLTSNSGASAELVTSGITGMYFRAGNSADLAAKLREMMATPTLLKRMRGPARDEYLRKYNSDISYARLLSIYEQAIARRSAAAPRGLIPQIRAAASSLFQL